VKAPRSHRLDVRVTPGGSRCALTRVDGALRIRLDARPVDGAANARLVTWLADEVLDVPRGAVRVLRGERGRQKIVEVDRPPEEVEAAIERWLAQRGAP
jgi:uncharacterized protein YggU (UPF0235/DUF167 family)